MDAGEKNTPNKDEDEDGVFIGFGAEMWGGLGFLVDVKNWNGWRGGGWVCGRRTEDGGLEEPVVDV